MTSPSGAITTPVLTDADTQDAVLFLGGLVHLRARAADTGGTFALLEHSGERGYMSPLHLHESDEETFLVLDGTLRVEVGDEVRSVGAGGLALLPRGLAHGFVVTSPPPASSPCTPPAAVSTRSSPTSASPSPAVSRPTPVPVPTRPNSPASPPHTASGSSARRCSPDTFAPSPSGAGRRERPTPHLSGGEHV